MKFLPFILFAGTALAAGPAYVVVDTGQTKCFDNRAEIAAPKPGQAFYGQDAQFPRHPASYSTGKDGLTVHDNVTGLTWQKSPDTDGDGRPASRDKLTIEDARKIPARLNASKFGGFDDWRLPTIKELYSLFNASGIDPSSRSMDADPAGLTPFLDTRFFQFAYGDASAGERVIDSQWATNTLYVARPVQMFGVNFADGRIKGYGTAMPGRPAKTFFVLCVRGNPDYGKNDFHDNGDGTVTDRATGLMWSKNDSGRGMNWQDALAWAQSKNEEKHLGHNDWRLPNVKELQSIVDYARSPDTSHSAAIDPVFKCTGITNEGGQPDFPFYWTSTTHTGLHGADAAMYVAFGRASGWLSGPPPGAMPPSGGQPPGGPLPPPPADGGGNARFTDVHGAGAQRSDPKTGNPAMFPHGRGPQGDVVRINNHVRLVRTIPEDAGR